MPERFLARLPTGGEGHPKENGMPGARPGGALLIQVIERETRRVCLGWRNTEGETC